MSDNLRGAFLMVASMAAFVFSDTFAKLLGATLPLFQILLLRGAVSLIFIAGLCQYFKAWRFDLGGRDWILIGARSLGDIGAAYFFSARCFICHGNPSTFTSDGGIGWSFIFSRTDGMAKDFGYFDRI